MTRKKASRLLALLLALVMVLGLTDRTVFAASPNGEDSDGITWEELDASEVEGTIFGNGPTLESGGNPMYDDADQVRAVIIMDNRMLFGGSEIMMVSEDPLYEKYQETMTPAQAMTATLITNEVLDGEPLDVIYSFDTVTDALAVSVEYGKLSEISRVRGVKMVILEQRYDMLDQSNNTVSQQMTGVDGVRSSGTGYYGAGTSVAVIDTGLELDHISFDSQAFEYALQENAAKAGLSYDAYLASLDLITEDRIAAVLDKLHVHQRNPKLTASDLYQNRKVPFAFNYATGTTDVSHFPDPDLVEGNEHGSHVSGISAANRYLPAVSVYDLNGDKAFNKADAQSEMDLAIQEKPVKDPLYTDVDGDGDVTAYDAYLLLCRSEDKYVSAADSVKVDGVAPDAQLVAMSVFREEGSAYSSDYVAALEDAILLGCDVSNLSLGSPRPGFSEPHMEYNPDEIDEDSYSVPLIDGWIEEVFQKAEDMGMVVSVAAGNAGGWADSDDAYQLLYTDEGGIGNLGAPGSYDQAFTVASVNNAGYYAAMRTVAVGSNGTEVPLAPMEFGGNPKPWEEMDPDGVGSEYPYVFIGDPANLFAGQEQTDLTIYAGSAEDFSGVDCSGKIAVVARGNTVSFIDKHQNAAAAGAIGVLVYNNEAGDINGTVAGDESIPPTTATIPIAGITLAEAKKMFANGTSGTLEIVRRISYTAPESDATEMSYFSSWGSTTNLSLKPEIATPGGSILSVNGANGNTTEYELMSGTSMASPHNAGLAALAADYIHADNDKVLSAAKTVSGKDLPASTLIQSLMMSTATPVVEHDGIEYSVRAQGAGLANIENLINAKTFLLVQGVDGGKVKAELGDRAGSKAGQPFTFTFDIYNLTSEPQSYTLSDSILTTGTTTIDGHKLATSEMERLGAAVSYSGAANGVVTVPANGKATVSVSISVTADAVAAMKRNGYANGFYVEGFIYLTGSDVTHSIPMLGWYGDWSEPSMYDKNDAISLYYKTYKDPSHIPAAGGTSKNVLTYIPHGVDPTNPGNNIYEYIGNLYNVGGTDYSDKRYIADRNSFNIEDPVFDFYAIFPTLVRSVKDFNIYITGVNADGTADFSKIYYRDHSFDNFDRALFASFYYVSQWYDVTTDYGLGIEWDGTDAEGEYLPEGTKFAITLIAVPEYGAPEAVFDEEGYEIGRPDLLEYANKNGTTLSWQFTVDNTAPKVVENKAGGKDTTFVMTSDNHLQFSVKDNRYVAAIVLLDGSGNTQNPIDYVFPDMDTLGGTYHADIDLNAYTTQFGNKTVIAVCDYAGNQTYYGINLKGEGTPYGEFVGFQFDGFGGSKWVSFDKSVNRNETSIFTCGAKFTAAEYVNGVVIAQAENGKLYGILYEDMLKNSVDLEQSYIATLDQVYSDFAYNYADGRLYGMYSLSDDYGNETHVDAIYLEETEGDWWETYEPYDVDADMAQQYNMVGYTLSIDDAGTLYILAATEEEPETEDGKTMLGTTAHLWKFTLDDDDAYARYHGEDVGDTKLTLDYLQSAAWNHNDETLYWSRFIPDGMIGVIAELCAVDPDTAKCTKVGTLSDETAGLFVPLNAAAAAKPAHANLPEINREELGAPIFDTKSLTLGVGATQSLIWYFDPWYSGHKDIEFESEDLSIAMVDDDGNVTGVSAGTTTITVSNTEDPGLCDTCTVTVASINATIEGIASYRGGASQLYTFNVENGVPSMKLGDMITADESLSYGLKIASSTQVGNTVWASEWGNTGMVYSIDPSTGRVLSATEPIDGDMMYGLAYSDKTNLYTGVMNYFIYADIPLPLTDQAKQEMNDSFDVKKNEFEWHRLDMSKWLDESQGNLVTQEDGDTSIVFCGITSMPGGFMSEITGGVFGGMNCTYTADTTWVLLDNVGRLWYIDEITGVKKDGNGDYIIEDGMVQKPADDNDIIELKTGDNTYSVFVIRELVKTPLYDKFMNDELAITYHFSAISYAGEVGIPDESYEKDSSPAFFFSLYDYHTEAKNNVMYLYVQNRENTYEYDSEYRPIYTKGSLYRLGETTTDYIIATINRAEYHGGLNETSVPVILNPGKLEDALPVTVYLDKDMYPYNLPDSYDLGKYWDIPPSLTFDHWTVNGKELDPYADDYPPLTEGLVFTAVWKERKPVTLKAGESLSAYGLNPDAEIKYYVDPDEDGRFSLPDGWTLGELAGFDIWDATKDGETVDVELYWKDSDGKEIEEEGPYSPICATYEEGATFTYEVREVSEDMYYSTYDEPDSDDDFFEVIGMTEDTNATQPYALKAIHKEVCIL